MAIREDMKADIVYAVRRTLENHINWDIVYSCAEDYAKLTTEEAQWMRDNIFVFIDVQTSN